MHNLKKLIIPHLMVLTFVAASVLNLLYASSLLATPASSIKIVMDDNYPPYVFRDEAGTLKGITIDQWKLWEQKTGVRAEVTATNWGEAQRRMQAGEFDVIDTIFRNEKREMIYDFTKPYARLDVPLYFHNDISGINTPADAKGFLVAAKEGDAAIDFLQRQGVTSITIYPGYEKLIQAAKEGKVKVFTVDKPPARYFLYKLGIDNQFRETAPMYSGEFHRAVRKGDDSTLFLVKSGFAKISAEEYRVIDERWMGRPLWSGISTKTVAIAFAITGGVLLILILWNFSLKIIIRRKTKELMESRQHFQTIYNSVNDAIFIHDLETVAIIDVNERMCEMYGLTREEALSSGVVELSSNVSPYSQADLLNWLNGARAGKPQLFEWNARHKDGHLFWVEVNMRRATVFSGEVILVTVRDITERKLAEEVQQASERRFAQLVQNSFDTVVILDADGIQRYVSQSAERTHGYTAAELVDIPVIERMIHPDDQEKVLSTFRRIIEIGEGGVQYRHRRKSGGWVHLDARGTNQLDNPDIRGVLVNVRDITEQKQAEEERLALERQLLHVQKLESLGILAGGIAHDFNNLLMAIMGNADMALMRLSKESPAVENLHKIEQASARAADLAKQMLAYSGKGKFLVEPRDLNQLLKEMLHMLEVSISKKAVLRLNPYNPLPAVEVDATQIRQIIMNLVINASEAIGDKSGIIAINTGCQECSEAYLQGAWLTDPIPEGLYVYLEIADTGCGMDKETMGKIFDPFYTTKFTGRGLGMAAVLGIVRGHKGAIMVYSELNKGTTFKILLPASKRPVELFDCDSVHDGWRGEGTVLMVDDDETVRGIGSDMLKELGFKVITANDGREALDRYREHPGIAIIILDLTMPHMDGEQCFRELRQIDPDVKVVMSSGFSEEEVAQKFDGKGLAGFIQKPYKLSMLRDEIKKATGAPMRVS